MPYGQANVQILTMEVIFMSLGRNIKAERKKLGLSLRSAASKIGISHVTLYYIEHDVYEPRCSTLSKIVNCYDINVENLFGKEQAK